MNNYDSCRLVDRRLEAGIASVFGVVVIFDQIRAIYWCGVSIKLLEIHPSRMNITQALE